MIGCLNKYLRGIDILVGTLRKRGRPKKDDGKSNVISIRLSKDERDMLDFICLKRNESPSNAMRQALRAQYNLAKFMN